MLSGIAGLIAASATFITAVGSLLGVIVVIRRTSPRERVDAARQAAEQVLNPPPPPTAVTDADALSQIRDARDRRDQA